MVRRYLAGVDRKYLVAGLVAGGVLAAVTTLLAALKFGVIKRLPLIGPDPAHLIEVRNERADAHEVGIEYAVDGEGMTHGPWRIKPGEIWGVRRVTDPGTLSVTVTVDGEERLQDTHKTPIPEEGSSAVVITLHEGGFVTSSVRFDDERPE
ncbi:hypothetical protein [Halovenus sp. HT40]|uniref:hypothetical protein n=1 Tax=Halovenus sp. HT40 TaxID=3126691 RepID=UPI00300EA572